MPRSVATALACALVALATLLAAPAQATEPSGGASAAPAVATAADASTGDTPVVLVGVAGLRWDDVSTLATPALWSLSREGAVGLVAARGANGAACPADGWLSLSAGTRAADLRVEDRSCRSLRDPRADGIVPGWQDFLTAADAQSFDATPGFLGTTLADAGVVATGIGPGAAIALADEAGVPVGTHLARPESATLLTQSVRDALTTSQLVVVDAGAVRDRGYATRPRLAEDEIPASDELPESDNTGDTDVTATEAIVEPTREQQAREIDVRISAVLRAVRGQDVTVIVVSLADSGRAALQLIAATGPAPSGDLDFSTAMLTSGSTRQVGLVQTTDLTPTVLAALGLADSAADLTGADVVAAPGPASATDRIAQLTDMAAEALQVTKVAGAFTTRLVLVQALLFLASAVVLTRAGRSDRRPLRPALQALRVASLALAAAPVASFLTGLVPWWLAGSPGLAFWGVLLGWVAIITALAMAGPWRTHVLGPAGVVAAVTVLVIAVDMLTGSTLVIDSPMGAHRILAARFYGMSNQAFALLTAAGVLLAAVLADSLVRAGRRGLATATVLAIGLVVVVVDGTPGLGSDFGGPPAIILAFAMLAIVVSGRAVNWRTLLLIGAVAGVAVGGFMVVDWLRPPGDRTHLGRFLATALDGGLWDVLYRKVAVNLRVLTSWRYLVLAIGGVALTAVVVSKPPRRFQRLLGTTSPLAGLQEEVPLLRPAVAAIGLALLVGFFMNDSGIVVPATGIAVAVPCLVAAAAQWRLGSRDGAVTATEVIPASAPAAG
ncbi:MAG: hypothetical protein HGA44_10940 [Cellulomonadaceae bacterium]|nr:hypothetical protein [Cellulomonadaceae bacterium]